MFIQVRGIFEERRLAGYLKYGCTSEQLGLHKIAFPISCASIYSEHCRVHFVVQIMSSMQASRAVLH